MSPDSSGALSQQIQTTLTAGSIIEKEIGGAEQHIYILPLKAGEFARIAVEQPSADAVLVLLKPDGLPLAEVNDYQQGEPEYLSLIAETNGDYQLKISSADPKAARASYKIRVEEWRASTPRDSQFVDAERKFSEATQSLLRGKADSLPRAEAIYGAALQQWRELGERRYEMKTLIYLGVVNEKRNNFQRAIKFYLQALPIARELGDRRFEGISLSSAGWGWHNLDEYRRALEYYEAALAIRQSLGIRRELAQSLTAIALAHTELGEANLALEAYRRSLPLARDSGDKGQYAFALNSMALLHIRLNENEQAINLLQESLPMWRGIGNGFGETSALNLMGMAYSNLFDMQDALSYYTQAIELAEKIGARYNAAQAYNNIGVQYWKLRDYDQALDCYERALRYWREIGNRVQVSRTLNNLGLIYHEKGDLDKSLELFKTALGDRVNGEYLPSDAGPLVNIALSHLKRWEIKQAPEEAQMALNSFQVALRLSREIHDTRMEVRALSGKAEAHLILNQAESALKDIDQAIAVAEKIRAEISSPEYRILSQPWMTHVYRIQVHTLMWRHREDPAAGYDSLALRTSEQYRLRTMLELLSESRIDLSKWIGTGYLGRLNELELKLESAENRRAQAGARKQIEKLAQIDNEIEELLREKDLLNGQIRDNHPQYAALKTPVPLSPSEIQRQLLDENTVLLEYMLGSAYGYIWMVTPDSISSYQLPPVRKIDQAARRVQELLASRKSPPGGETLKEKHARQAIKKTEFDQAAAELSRMILGPLAGKLGKKRLLIVGDGILHYIPFGVLPEPETERQRDRGTERRRDKKTGSSSPRPSAALSLRPSASQTPLIVNHEIVTLPSASVLATLRRLRTGRSPAPYALAVLADPVFSGDDERVEYDAPAKPDKIQAPDHGGDAGNGAAPAKIVSDVERSAEDSGIQVFRRLLFSRQEAEAITGLLPPSERLKALDFAADRQLALGGKLGEYRILHFATHGLLNSKTPALSGLVLSLVDEHGRPRNGFLRLHEIYDLKLNADLVVLSGCQTALGQEVSGEGLIGLTRGFMHAGAQRVVASLWNVNDQATANLMKLFYHRMLKDGLRPAAALRAAQIEMWKAEPNAVPYRWGAFILQGDWR
ncbi:MAG TPA: CHAT domain-containing tetratricopeptide repeat protein [Blastocatellia bacterium]|nr:CHAT domain-containing tetratricopeptide repeat protein [Blastocatellia bacterium]